MSIAFLGYAHARLGERKLALRALDQLGTLAKQRYVSALWFALVYVGLGETNQAFLHKHPSGVVIVQTDGHLKFTLADGKTEERTVAAGSVRYRPAVKHAVENPSGADVEVIEVELKAKPAGSQ